MRISQVGLSIALLATVAALAAAQPTSASSPANRGMPSAVKAPDYGTASLTHVRVSAMEFLARAQVASSSQPLPKPPL